MPEDEDNPVHPTSNEDKKETGKTCLQIKALRDKARALTIAENARLRGLSEVEFDSSSDAEEIHYESKTTNTEEVNKGIYFSYPSRRHSCALVNIPSPCVSKMIAHIEDVESKIQEHLKQFAASFEEWTSAAKGEKGDLGVSAPEKVVHPEKGRDEKCPELKRKMESLLSEAIHLVKSLETDRAEAEQALRQQKSRKKRISMKIDSWSIWKLQELPTAVQKEYENYSKDIEELKLHLEDTTQQVEYLEKEKKQLEEANAKIQKDIDYMTNHRPLLEKKRKQEVEALKERYYKKFEVMELFRAVHEELKDSVDQCECTKSKLKLMKEEDEKDIFQEQINIELYKKELDELSSLETQYSNSIESASFDIEEDEETVSEAMRETESTTNDISTLMKSIDTLKKLFDQYLWKQRNSEKQYMDTLNNYYSSKKTWDIELSNVSKDFTDVSANYTELLEENKRLQTDIDKLTVDIGESIRKKMEYEEEIQSLLQEKIKNNVYLKQLYKQAYQIGAIYHVAKQKTDELEAKIADTRKKFKNREDFLKKLTRGEMTAGIEIQKRLYIIEETQFVEMQEFLRRRALYNLALSEVQFPLRQIEADAVRIRLLHRQHSSILHELMKKKEFVKKKVEATKKKLRKRSKKSRKELTQTEGKGSVILQEIEETKNKTIIFNAKSKELGKEIKMMEQEKKNYDDKLEKLKDEFITLRFDKDKMQSVYDHLRHEKQMCEERMFQEERLFKTFVEARQSALMNIQTVQDQSLEENLRLAKKYQAIQMLFLKEKDECLSGFDRLLSLSASLCDKKKLCQLQGKLDKNWEEYFRLVILFNQQRLDKFQEEAQDGIQKIILVQEESSGLMQHIVDFFQTLTDGACEKDD